MDNFRKVNKISNDIDQIQLYQITYLCVYILYSKVHDFIYIFVTNQLIITDIIVKT